MFKNGEQARLQNLRDKTDYGASWQSTEDDAKPLIAPAKDLLAKIKSYINAKSE